MVTVTMAEQTLLKKIVASCGHVLILKKPVSCTSTLNGLIQAAKHSEGCHSIVFLLPSTTLISQCVWIHTVWFAKQNFISKWEILLFGSKEPNALCWSQP